MNQNLRFNFKTNLPTVQVSSELNNPFGSYIPEIAKLAAKEFQEHIVEESKQWEHDFSTEKGKMFGVLVVQDEEGTYFYLGAVSGKLPKNIEWNRLVPSVFDESTEDYFISRGLTKVTEIGTQIKNSDCANEITALKEKRTQKSMGLQQRLFENYNFLNLSGKEINLLDIFKYSFSGRPPAAAGECSAPKLLQYAIKHELKPIAIAEFWWGSAVKNKHMEHQLFYPACKDRCRPILEYMLEDSKLYDKAKKISEQLS